MNFSLFDPSWLDTVGVVGFGVYVTTYSLLTMRVLSGDSIVYFCLNFLAASLVLIGLSVSFNLASALIQSFWITMSVIGISIRLLRPSIA